MSALLDLLHQSAVIYVSLWLDLLGYPSPKEEA